MQRWGLLLLVALGGQWQPALAAGPGRLAFDTYGGYFVSNKFEPDAAESFVVLRDQAQFDQVFGVAFVMGDTSHRLPKDAFSSLLVIAPIKRGGAMVEYKVEGVTEANGVVELRYTTASTKSDTATFACPLIVSIAKGQYKAIRFVENGRLAKTIAMDTDAVLPLADAKLGQLPHGWAAAKTGSGPGSVWKVLADADGKKVLAQTSAEGPNRLFNLCIAEQASFRDLDLTVAFKAVAGQLDQGGGPLWRCQDADNYYIARLNPLEDNYRVYKVVAGKRKQLATADVKVAAGRWHTLRVVQKADHIDCYLDGKLYLDVKDDTFPKAGKIGLWTKADAQTYFADLKIVEP